MRVGFDQSGMPSCQEGTRMVPDLGRVGGHSVVGRQVTRGSTVVTLAGELDLAELRLLRRMLTRLPTASLPNMVADLRRVSFMDCSALGAFVAAYRTAQSQGGCLRIVATQPQPLGLLQISRLDRVFCLHVLLETAVDPLCPRHLPTS
jgi:anti-anti-sigma factor